MTHPAISLWNVNKTYLAAKGSVHAVHDVSLNIEAGHFVSILGPSGCGKSTLLMMMAGLEDTTSGVILVDNKELVEPRLEFGLVFQEATLLPWLSVLDNVLFPVRMMKKRRVDYEERARRLLDRVGLGNFVHHRPRELSGGMRQRVALCRALIHEPSKIFMDEPFSALDAISRDDMAQVLLDLWEQDNAAARTAVFVTHSIREAVLLSDRVVVMGKRPAAVKADIAIRFDRPRRLELQETREFNDLVRELRQHIEH